MISQNDYYSRKWGAEMFDETNLNKLVKSYLEGLQWCLLYYYQGTPSWAWFYPYFYAPLASSMINLSEIQISYDTHTHVHGHTHSDGVFFQFYIGDPFLSIWAAAFSIACSKFQIDSTAFG